MKKFLLYLYLILMVVSAAHAQITITAADMPNTGDTLRMSQATPASVLGKNFAATGANHTWDFSTLMPASQYLDTFVSVMSTPILYYPTFLATASIALKGESFSMSTFSLTNVYDFFKETTSAFTQVGFAAQFSGIPLPTLYSSPDYWYRFPLNFQDKDSCQFGYTVAIPTLFSLSNQSKRVNMVDGWGTLITPFGTFQTLRIMSVITSRDSLQSDSLPFPIPPTTTVTTEYKWLANGHRAPLLTVTNRGGMNPISTVAYRDHFLNLASVQNPEAVTTALSIHPNPTSGKIRISHTEGQNGTGGMYRIADLAGKTVMQGAYSFAGNSYHLDISSLPSGIYVLQMVLPSGLTGTARIVKN